MSDKLPDDLAALAAQAEALEDSAASATAAPGADTATLADGAVDWKSDATGLVKMVATAAAQFWPSTGAVLDDGAIARLGAALAPVMEKYNFSLLTVFGRWGAEIQLAFVASSFAVPLVAAVKADRLAAHNAKLKEINEGGAAVAPPGPVDAASLYKKA